MLLCAIYNRPYTIGSIDDLVNLTDLASYYCALPAVSRTLANAFHDSQGFIDTIAHNPCPVFEAAAKLRHKVLFREALIWVVGPFQKPRFENLSDRRLRQVARCVYGEIATIVSRSAGKFLAGLGGHGNDDWSAKFRKSTFGDGWCLS